MRIKSEMVSVCMVTYNHGNYIKEAIESVLLQKANFDIRLIIGDDCSSDNTPQIVEKVKKNHPKGKWITYVRRECNIGMMANFIDLLSRCSGNYIALCDGDDFWTDPVKLQRQIDFLEANEDFVLSYHSVETEPRGKNFKMLKNYDHQFDFRDTLKLKQGPTASMVFRNILKTKTLPSQFFKAKSADWALELWLLNFGKGFYFKEKMGVYRVHDQGVSKVKKFRVNSEKAKFWYVMSLLKKFPTNIAYYIPFLFSRLKYLRH
ncbi:glycosyltransferase [Marivirga sp.]|uniref:glycosyltransferase n=1 Tax=Marivirga sp. TaxID=2018662 RepID=UPI002D805BA3|nr:glycosyltransferase [Marivirga sp.]HET8860554.1 glycosyltransferase [Marivirga sp.]